MLDAAIVVAVLGLLIWLAYRGISVLVLALLQISFRGVRSGFCRAGC